LDIEDLKYILRKIIDVLDYLNGESAETFGGRRKSIYEENDWIRELIDELGEKTDEERS